MLCVYIACFTSRPQCNRPLRSVCGAFLTLLSSFVARAAVQRVRHALLESAQTHAITKQLFCTVGTCAHAAAFGCWAGRSAPQIGCRTCRDDRFARWSHCWPQCRRGKGTYTRTFWQRPAHLSLEIVSRNLCADLLGQTGHCCWQQRYKKDKRSQIALLQAASPPVWLGTVAPPSCVKLYVCFLAPRVLHLGAFAPFPSLRLDALVPLPALALEAFGTVRLHLTLCNSCLAFNVLHLAAFGRFPPLLWYGFVNGAYPKMAIWIYLNMEMKFQTIRFGLLPCFSYPYPERGSAAPGRSPIYNPNITLCSAPARTRRAH